MDNKVEIVVKLEVEPGDMIEDVIREGIKIAKASGLPVEFEFNETLVRVTGESNAIQVHNDYWRKRAA